MFVQLGNQRFKTNHTVLDQTDWDFKPWFAKWQVDEIWEQDIKPTKNFWMTLKTLPGTTLLQAITSADRPETLWNLKRAELFFITSRVDSKGMSAREQACWWLRNHFGLTYPTVIVVEDSNKKAVIAKSLELDSFIDDKVRTCIQMHEQGIRSYIKLCPYNCSEQYPAGIEPVENLDQFLTKELSIGT